jgi:hypothetical protein
MDITMVAQEYLAYQRIVQALTLGRTMSMMQKLCGTPAHRESQMNPTTKDLERIMSLCGNPDPAEACRLVIAECERIMGRAVNPYELWALAQLLPGEGIEDGVRRIKELLEG